jgi:superfamily II DNA or RNA helicase
MIRDLKEDRLQVVTNYAVLTEGFDEPRLAAGILARPTKNLGLYIQMGGRILRPCEETGKVDARLIDHSGNVYEHGFIQDEHNWVLEEGKALNENNKDRQKKLDDRNPITCVKCATVYYKQLPCPTCGHVPEVKGKHVESRSGELMEVRIEKRRTALKKVWTMEEKQLWYSMFLQHCDDKGYSEGWASHKYKEKFGVWPRQVREQRQPISPECRAYIRYLNIKGAKQREKQNAANNQASSTG